jgi:uncharacterized delta-60 repeat protein
MALISSGSFVAANDKTLSNTFSFVTSASLGIGNPSVLFIATDNINTFIDAWSAGGTMITARQRLSGAGIRSAALAFGGGVTNTGLACTEAYNGTSWTAGGAMINARLILAGAGTQNSALGFGGTLNIPTVVIACTEAYNGSTWSTGGIMINARASLAGAGASSTAALAFGGSSPLGACTEIYNGSTWTAGNAMITTRSGGAGAGIQNDALSFGGALAPLGTTVGCTESYNGTSWFAKPGAGAMANARNSLAGAGASSTAALAFGGYPFPLDSCTEAFNGVSWSTRGALSTARYRSAGAGTQNSALAFGGFNSPLGVLSSTEVYNFSGTSFTSSQITSITDCLFNYSFGGTGSFFNNTVRAFATQSDGKILVGGDFTTYNNVSQSYLARLDKTGSLDTTFIPTLDGPVYKVVIQPNVTGSIPLGVWTSQGAMITARGALAGAGTQNAALGFGGQSSVGRVACTEAYNGTSWSAGGAMITVRGCLGGVGIQNAALGFGGYNTFPNTAGTCTEAYNGSTWSAGGALITAMYFVAGAGTQNAALAFAGGVPARTCTEAYNGTSWSAGGALSTARYQSAGTGTSTAALAFGGAPGSLTCTEAYNGTSWTAGGVMITGRSRLAGSGNQNAALGFGGIGAAVFSCTEAYNGSTWSARGAMIVARLFLGGAGTQTAALALGGYTTTPAATRFSCTEAYLSTSFITSGSCISDKIVAVGAFNVANTCIYSGSARFNPDSSLDGTYNIGTGSNSTVCTVLVQPTTQYTRNSINYTNKLILGGTFTAISGSTSSGSVRLNGDGTVDTTFNIGAGFSGSVDVRTIVSTGSLLVFGGNFTFYSGSSANRIVFVDSGSGNITSSANIGTGFNNVVNSIAIQYDNNILVTGNFTQYSGSNINRLARISPAGVLDTAFSASMGTGLNNTGSVVYIYPNALEAWSARTTMITARQALAGAGTSTAALAFGGNTTPVTVACTEAYNGTSWSAGGTLIIARQYLAGAGTQNTALAFGGAAPATALACTEAYNGISWSVGGAMITARILLAGAGTQNAGLAFAGATPIVVACTEAYNGSTWSAGGALIIARQYLAGAGTQNTALAFGGSNVSGCTCTEAYNGTSWAAGGAMINARQLLAGAGTQTAALGFGGFSPTVLACTEAYNGTSWSAKNAMITARCALGGAGTQNAALAFGGNTGPGVASCVEAFNTPQIIIGGIFTAYSGSTYSGSVRMNISGTLDTTYNIGTTGFSGSTAVNDYLFYSPSFTNSAILAGGNFTTYSSSLLSPAPTRIVLLNTDGTISGSKASTISWNKVAEYTEATSGSISGSTIAMFYGSASATVPANFPFIVTLSGSVTAKAVTGWSFRNTNNSRALGTYVGIFTSSIDRNSPQTMDLSGSLPFYGNYILVRATAFKGPGTSSFITSSGFTQLTGSGTIGGISSSNMSIAGEFLASSGSDLVGIGSSTKSQPQYSGSTSNSSIYYAIYEPFSRTSVGSSN